MAPPSWIRLPRATLTLILLALHLSLSVAAQFKGFDSDELPHAAADLASPDDDDKGLDLDVDLPPPISVSVSSPSPPVTTTTAPAESAPNPTKEIFSELDEINAQDLIFPRSFQKTGGDTKWGHEVATPQGGAAKEGPAALWCGPPRPCVALPPTYPPSRKPYYRHDMEILPDAAAANPISGIREIGTGRRGESSGGLYITMPASGLMRQ
ncbi:hypothetical protein QYE76_026743 [Lolium multiflorum]|uniref:Uncharacterized protein n=1 Tax=Lolium multiflorum TaxID=4521 RepID=A0AAD8RIA0_LOLMU|nr:hypothetical protein QYE76_026743 [Lolium multiflorum]